MNFDKALEEAKKEAEKLASVKNTKGKYDKLSKKPKKIIRPDDGGISDQGPTGFTGAADVLKKAKVGRASGSKI